MSVSVCVCVYICNRKEDQWTIKTRWPVGLSDGTSAVWVLAADHSLCRMKVLNTVSKVYGDQH